jgi:hypothetical protein
LTGAVTASSTVGITGVTTHGGNVVSDTDSTDDLGTTGVRWANLYVDDVVATTTVKPGTLVLAAGSITDTSGAITFGNENLVTTGTFGAAATTLSSTLAVTGATTLSNILSITRADAGTAIGATIRVNAVGANTGYGMYIEAEATAATSYALQVRNLAANVHYLHIATETAYAGNVGINTNTPAYKLHVAGTLGVTGNTSFNATYRMAAVGLSEYATNGNGNFPINFRGYNDGTTQFRDFTVYDGKETAILTVDGSAATVTLAGTTTVQRESTGVSTNASSVLNLEGNAAVYASFISNGASEQGFLWSDAGSTAAAQLVYNHGSGTMGFTAETLFSFNKSVYINDSANANATLGLTINQGANDNEILALKSSDVAHGMTDEAETDTWGVIKKASPAAGGMFLVGYRDATGSNDAAIMIDGRLGEAASTTKATSSVGVTHFRSWVKSSATIAAVGSDGNLLTIANAGTTRFIFDAEGSGHADIEWTTF